VRGFRPRLHNPVGCGCGLVVGAAATLVYLATDPDLGANWVNLVAWAGPLLGVVILGPVFSIALEYVLFRLRRPPSQKPPDTEDTSS
jgi:hypothetical protein